MNKDDRAPAECAANLAESIASSANLLVYFASPAVFEKADKALTKGIKNHARDHLDTLAQSIRSMDSSLSLNRVLPALDQFMGLLKDWQPADSPAEELIIAARQCIRGLGFPEPPSGWDCFTG